MGSMLSLLDVLPRHELVDIGGGSQVAIYGISTEDLGKLLTRFPKALQQLVNSGGKPAGLEPALMGAVLAAATRKQVNGHVESCLGDDKAEWAGRGLGVGVQMKMLQAVGRCTFPDGIGPFLEGLGSITSAATDAMNVVVQVVSKESDTTSPPPPSPSESPDTPTSGN